MRKYWTFQLIGWGGYSAVGIVINLLNGAPLGPLVLGHLLLIGCSIGLTHLLRRGIHARRRTDRSISSLWPFLTTGMLAISVVQAALVIGANVALTRSPWTPTAIVALWWGMFLATAAWTILYVRFSDQRRQQAQEYQLTLTLREAELRALESQINPHFFFNCLNSIRALVAVDPARAQDMLTRLANVLRNSLRHDRDHTVPLAAEMEGVNDYLALEMVRFDDRLSTSVAIHPATSDYPVPPLLVQTLVENAIKHGIAHVTGSGELTVRAQPDDAGLCLVVENTGHLDRRASTDGHVGLKNVRERLRLLYGDAARFSLDERDGKVAATVLIPTPS